MKDKDLKTIIEAYDLLYGVNSMDSTVQTPLTIRKSVFKIMKKYDRNRLALFKKPTIESSEIYRGLKFLYHRLCDKYIGVYNEYDLRIYNESELEKKLKGGSK